MLSQGIGFAISSRPSFAPISVQAQAEGAKASKKVGSGHKCHVSRVSLRSETMKSETVK